MNIYDVAKEAGVSLATVSRVINGSNVPLNLVKSTFLKVGSSHIQYVVNVINNYNNKISNMKNFIITTLYNSVLTLDAYYINLVTNTEL